MSVARAAVTPADVVPDARWAPSGRGPAPLWWVRHAQPLIAPGLCYGGLDVAADAQANAACADALLLAWTLRVKADVRVCVRHSPLKRCVQLAQALHARRPEWVLHADARLGEMDFGRWEGQPWDSLCSEEWAAWMADFWTYRCGGGQSLAQFWAPVQALWDERQSLQTSAQAQPELWVTHAGVLRVLALLQTGVQQVTRAADWPAHTLGYGEWLALV